MVVALGVPATVVGATSSTMSAGATLAHTITNQMPLVRLHFAEPVSASALPRLRTTPSLATTWQQIGPRDVQAVALGGVRPAVRYRIAVPTQLRCATTCRVVSSRTRVVSSAANLTWLDQLLAQLRYLPVTFTPLSATTDPTVPTPGTYTWAYPNLPTILQDQWQVGTDNVILKAAVMSFQDVHHLPTTGVADATTWKDIVADVTAGTNDPRPYNYVDVSESLPETATLYIAGVKSFTTVANTGIPASPTALGTYPVYLRFRVTTMSGTNPDGSTYHDTGIQWVSYFNGGDGLHEFPRATYGSPQSLGCVEMPMAAAARVWPHTPIGTLVTVHA